MTTPLADLYAAQPRRSDKGTRHSYIEIYETLLAPYRTTRPRVLEIGVKAGASLALWRDYFPGGHICGVDIRPPSDHPTGCWVLVADATQPAILDLLDGDWDVIVDDASHRVADQIATFDLLRTRLAPGGLYVIEDIQSDADRDTIQERTRGGFEVIDLRGVKGRYDDVLMVFREG